MNEDILIQHKIYTSEGMETRTASQTLEAPGKT